MTLAAVFLTGMFCIVPAASDGTGRSTEQAPQTAPATQDQTSSSQSASPQAAQSQPASSPAKSNARRSQPRTKKPVSKKKPVNSGCDTPDANSAPSTNSTSATATGTTDTSAQKPATPNTPTNCPPEKIIVRHGGTTEPSIQLAGGPGGQQASDTRDATTHLLDETETNLKRLTGQQLSANQKDSVTQIHQFVEQSRSALAAGENERAKTLANKAKLLSEDLVQPQK